MNRLAMTLIFALSFTLTLLVLRLAQQPTVRTVEPPSFRAQCEAKGWVFVRGGRYGDDVCLDPRFAEVPPK